ncbi:MAG: short-chain dehydrogenase [Actinobacteria bacterium 13_1_20CM_3_71_11]|nr:MAG: short-chain dehydrogenase [Actinobacteria bacterium 13_1_20CM_3_71_11]
MGRQAVVSGGGTGIGAAVARALAEDGFQVVIVGRRASVLEATARELGDAVRPVVADLTSVPDVERLASTVDGQVDVLVNNAGGFDLDREDGLAGTADWWRRVYDSNVISAVLLTEALRDRLAHPAGRVILLSSVAAQRGRAGPYSAAKAALHGWAYDLARDLGPHGATVNVIAPGYVAETEFFGGRLTEEGHATRVAETLVGRAGRPADIAAAVRYLAGPDSGYVTGQILSINGGIVFGR